MGSMKDLLGFDEPMTNYPESPGFKASGTSMEAAAKVASTAKTLRMDVLALLRSNPDGLTADECAEKLGHGVLGIRPRLSELVKTDYAVRTKHRRMNASGLSAAVYIAKRQTA